MKGVDISTIQELLGRKSIVMTKRYSHPTPEHKKEAVEKLNITQIGLNEMPITSLTGPERRSIIQGEQ